MPGAVLAGGSLHEAGHLRWRLASGALPDEQPILAQKSRQVRDEARRVEAVGRIEQDEVVGAALAGD